MSVRVCRDPLLCGPRPGLPTEEYPCDRYVTCTCGWARGAAHCKVCGHRADCHVRALETTQVPLLAAGRLA